MAGDWYRLGSKKWWVVTTLLFFGFELIMRAKLGSVYVLCGFYVLAFQWIALKLGHDGPERDPANRLLFAMYSALFVCAVIFIVFSAANVGLRGVDNNWKWFQLP